MLECVRLTWLAVLRFVVPLIFRANLYKLKSNVYRAIFERRFRDLTLEPVQDFASLVKMLLANHDKYEADGWRQLGDAVSYPQVAQEVFAGRYTPTQGFDCDDFAIYTTAVCAHQFPSLKPRFLSIVWLQGWGYQGHNVCLLEQNGLPALMDYGAPFQDGATITDVILAGIKNVAPPGAALICWASHDSNLNVLEVGH